MVAASATWRLLWMRWLGQNEEEELGSKRRSSWAPFGLCGRSWVQAVWRLGEMLTRVPLVSGGEKKEKEKEKKRGGRGAWGWLGCCWAACPGLAQLGYPAFLFCSFLKKNLVPFITFVFELQISSTSF
jgi:hypothetical protein